MTYPWVALYGFRREAAYPLSALAEALTNSLFGFARASILAALWHARPALGGYDVADAVTFCFLTQALIAPVGVFGGMELTERIRNGDVAIDLYRPADLQLWWLASEFGRSVATLLLRAAPPMLIGALLFRLRWPDPAHLAAFALSVPLAILIGFGVRYLVALAMFWLHDDRGLASVALVAALFCSGMIVPLNIFPGAFGTVVRALPWAGTVQVPADLFLGRGGVWTGLGFQLGWLVALLGLGRLVTLAAGRRLVIHGG